MSEIKRIGVTGAGGYIGSRVAAAFKERGNGIVPIDNFYESQVETIGETPILEIDVRDREALRTAFEDVDAIMHLAAITGVPECEANPEAAFDINVGGTENVAWVCREREIPLVFPASMAVVGDPVDLPVSAEHPRAPLNLYGRTKQMSEDDVHALAEGSFPALVLIMSNLYGHHELDGRTIGKRTVMNIFVERALAGEPLTVHEPGTQARDFIHVHDAARAYVVGLEYLADASDGAESLPIASGESSSVLQIAQTVQRIVDEELDEQVEIEMVDNPRSSETVSEDFTVETETAERKMGYETKRSIESTIRRMVQP